MKQKMNEFSIALGLFDYINPIFYSITSITLIINMLELMKTRLFLLMLIGCIISIIFGLSIPTVKLLVGLGKMKFKMPVNLVAYVNSGILITGISLFSYVYAIEPVVIVGMLVFILITLSLIYVKTKKTNTIAVLIGMFGYLLVYISLITIALRNGYVLSVVLYAVAICLFLFLVVVGCKANLKDAKVHWLIEISNAICQGLVAISTVLLFTHIV